MGAMDGPGPAARQPSGAQSWGLWRGAGGVLADSGHDRHRRVLGWFGGEFEPEAFNLWLMNARQKRLRLGRGRKAKTVFH